MARAHAALRRRRAARIRYALIAVLVLAAIGWMLASTYVPDLQVCESTLSDLHVRRTCHGIGTVQLIPFAIGIGLLLFPELAEASVAGLMSIKRRGDDAAEA